MSARSPLESAPTLASPAGLAAGTPRGPLLLPGQIVGGYRVVGSLGRGGMGEVVAAIHCWLERPAAIKVLRAELSASPEFRERFLNEGRAVCRARHPGLVEVFEFGELPDGNAYIIMELLEGLPLSSCINPRGPLSLPELVDLLAQVAAAMAAAHDKGVVHRDLKPSNVMVIDDPERPGRKRAKVLDFGLAKILEDEGRGGPQPSKASTLLGTPEYMAPEQCMGQPAGTAADVYSLGVMLYEALADELPFKADLAFELMAMQVRQGPPPLGARCPAAPPALVDLVHAMLAKAPEARPSMAEVAGALRGVLASGALADVAPAPAAPGPPARYTTPRTLVRRVLGKDAAPPRAAPARILLVDDMVEYTYALSALLEGEGYACQVLYSGERVLDTVRTFRPDLVLLDVELPGKSGFRLCWEIKSQPGSQDVLVALVSGKSEEGDHRMGLAMQADAYLDKPFEAADLLALVRLLLDRQHDHDAA